MRVLTGKQARMRIFIGEDDSHRGKPLYKALVEMLREEKIAGATVLRGVVGYGARSHLHTANLLRLSGDLPMVIEVVDTRERLDAVMPRIDAMIGDGMVTMETVEVVRYAPNGARS